MSKYRLPEFKRNLCIVPLALLLAIFTIACPPNCPPPCPSPDRERERVVLIFSDVTSSLLESESNEVGTLTSNVVDTLIPGTRYYVYPIQIEAQKLKPMYEGTIIAQDRGTAKAVNQARRTKISEEIKALYDKIKSVKRSDAYGNPDNHTCILYTLEFAQNVFKQFDQSKTDFDLVYVSDMIEECNTTPMGKPISLGKANISEAIKLAQQTNLNLNLFNARVSMIIPATNDSYVARGRPNVSDLRNFWKAILLHCGFNQEFLESGEKFYFSSGLPKYLDESQ
jgi:hypothetical protein